MDAAQIQRPVHPLRAQDAFGVNRALLTTAQPFGKEAVPGDGVLDEVLKTFAKHNALGAGLRQVQFNLAVIGKFLRASGLTSLHAIDQPMIVEYLSGLRISAKTLRNYATAISRFCSWLETCGVLPGNPTRGLRLPKLQPPMPHYLEDKEIIMLLDLAGRLGIYAEVCLALNTGLRRGELRMLRWDQVDLSRRILKIPAGKSKRPGIVPLNTEAQKVLEQQRAVSGRLDYVFPGWRSKRVGLKNAPRGMNWWCSAMEQFCRAIPAFGRLPKGSTGRGWHMLRHTFASRLVQKGVSIYKVSRWLRHSSVQTTQIYAHLAEGWDEDIEKVSGKIGDIP